MSADNLSFQSTRDKVASLPGMHGSFTDPTGTYRVTIEIPSKSVSFGHTWKWFDWFAPETPSGALALLRCERSRRRFKYA